MNNRNIPTWLYEDTKSIEHLGIYIGYGQEMKNALSTMIEKLDLEIAEGKQLDLIASLYGLNRNFPIAGLSGYDGKLDDLRLKRLVKGQISASKWDGSKQGLEEAIKTAFGSDLTFVIQDNMDMSMVVYVIGLGSSNVAKYVPDPIDLALITSGKYIPKPSGVDVSYVILENPIFTFDSTNNVYKAGWDVGVWYKEE